METKQLPITLGDALGRGDQPVMRSKAWGQTIVYAVINAVIWVIALIILLTDGGTTLGAGGALFILALMWMGLSIWYKPTRGTKTKAAAPHFLLANDIQGFMGALRLDAKYAVFDGSNVFHFGVDQGVGGAPLRLMAAQLRSEGYRVVCFFDANIYYRLIEHGIMEDGQHHDIVLLLHVFGLTMDEVYIVPSGVQADRFILSTLKHLPQSFAITNDRFRDYGKIYGDVMVDDQWRKGVSVVNGEIKLQKFRFQTAVRLSAGKA